MQVQLMFKDLVNQVAVLLKKHGFKKQGNLFYKQEYSNWCLVAFQKSMRNTASEIFFTINLGVCSQTIRDFFSKTEEKRPIIADCHWTERLGFYVGTNEDIWWQITENTDLLSLVQEIKFLLVNRALLEIEKLTKDEQLLNFWSSKYPRLDFGSKVCMAVLLRKSGKFEELSKILLEMEKENEGRPTESFFNAVKSDLLS